MHIARPPPNFDLVNDLSSYIGRRKVHSHLREHFKGLEMLAFCVFLVRSPTVQCFLPFDRMHNVDVYDLLALSLVSLRSESGVGEFAIRKPWTLRSTIKISQWQKSEEMVMMSAPTFGVKAIMAPAGPVSAVKLGLRTYYGSCGSQVLFQDLRIGVSQWVKQNGQTGTNIVRRDRKPIGGKRLG
ncbi:hypothetical protein CPB85DRAFT_1253761 [Mucidula mucida]|nr:hypothetical protein CPB85DRAFT_1253761 [Mucidula mucida]